MNGCALSLALMERLRVTGPEWAIRNAYIREMNRFEQLPKSSVWWFVRVLASALRGQIKLPSNITLFCSHCDGSKEV